MMRTANPALNEGVFKNAGRVIPGQESMTIKGTVNKSFIMLFLLFVTASYSWQQSLSLDQNWSSGAPVFQPSPLLWIGLIGGFVVALITIFKKTWSPITAPLYAALEGLFLGAISASFEARYPGIASQAIFGTLGVFGALLLAYRSGLVKATENFKLGVVAATGGIAILYLAQFALSFFGIQIPGIFGSGLVGIAFSLVVITIAALNLVLDFDFIENGEAAGAPKYMEWYASFGLMVTLVWLYLEMLRLLSKLQSRN